MPAPIQKQYHRAMNKLARMIDWFDETHGLPFTGFLIGW